MTECPWELVRSCTEDYSFTLYNKHTGDACRDYRGRRSRAAAVSPNGGGRRAAAEERRCREPARDEP